MFRYIWEKGVYWIQLFKLIRIAITTSKRHPETEGTLISLHLGIWNFNTVLTIEWRPYANRITFQDWNKENAKSTEKC